MSESQCVRVSVCVCVCVCVTAPGRSHLLEALEVESEDGRRGEDEHLFTRVRVHRLLLSCKIHDKHQTEAPQDAPVQCVCVCVCVCVCFCVCVLF